MGIYQNKNEIPFLAKKNIIDPLFMTEDITNSFFLFKKIL